MRILLLATNYAPELTGSGKYTSELGAWFAARGHAVTAIVGPPHYPEWQVPTPYAERPFTVERIERVDVRRVPMLVPPPDSVTSARRIVMESSFTLAATRWAPLALRRDSRPDVMFAVCPPLQVGALGWLLARVGNFPWVFHVQDLQVDAATRLDMLSGRRVRSALLALERRILAGADAVSTITEAMRASVVAKGIERAKTLLLPNWADVDLVRPSPADDELRLKLGAGRGQTLFLYAGNIGKKQGLDVLIDAADRLREKTNVRVAVVGAGADRNRLVQQAKDRSVTNVSFHDLVPSEELPRLLAAADVHLVLQKRQAADVVMPSKLTNILAAGRPTIATADAGTELHRVLTEHDAGDVVPPEDPVALAQALLRSSEAPARRTEMGWNARRYAERYLDKDAILARFEHELVRLVERRTTVHRGRADL